MLPTYLCLNDWKGGQGSTSLGVAHLGGSLQETRVKVENVTRVGFTTWWTSQKERHLTVSNGLLGQIVENDKSVHAIVTEKFTHGATGVGGQVLQRSGIRGSSRDDNAGKKGKALL